MGPAAFLLALCAAAAAGDDLAWRRPPLVDHGVVSFIHLPKTGGTSLIMALAAWAEARGLPFFHDHGTCDPSHGRTCEALSPRRPRTYGLPTRRWEATVAAAAPGALKWPLLFASHGVRHGTVAFWQEHADPVALSARLFGRPACYARRPRRPGGCCARAADGAPL